MGSLTEDLWEIILARLPLKSITASKLVCKQWKTIVESPFFRELFLSHHQNSHSSWSLFSRFSRREFVSHYGCETWGLTRSLGSYVSSFLADKFKTQKEKAKVRVLAYTDVGLILFTLRSKSKNPPYYVANPISRQCVKLPPRPHGIREKFLNGTGLATRVEKDVLLGYKVVFTDTSIVHAGVLSLLVYSSETGLWSYNTLQSHPQFHDMSDAHPITLNGNIYWFGYNLDYLNGHNDGEVLVSHDLYAESDRCRVLVYPDVWQRNLMKRSCTISQGFLLYTNFVSVDQGYKLRAWRLKNWEWQLVSEISNIYTSGYFFLGINPFDGNTMYMWSRMHEHFASTNLYKRQFGLRSYSECSSDGGTLSFSEELDPEKEKYIPFTLRLALPRWLHRIPS